jgi:hypothetical protein
MRITRDTLLKAAKTAVQQRTYRDRDIVCVYLTGSLIDDLPLLGGTADIDLFFIHDKPPVQPREVIRLTPDIHLDLAHHDQSIYNQPRELRLNPWVGSYLIKDPIVLFAKQHWFEFTQATVFSHFNQPENVIGRSMPFAETARQIWLDFQLDPPEPDIKSIRKYLQALEKSSNALAILNGVPITKRRFILTFTERIADLGHSSLSEDLKKLIALKVPSQNQLREWQKQWQITLKQLGDQPDCPVDLNPIRHPYYTRAAEALMNDHPEAALWIMLNTWTESLQLLDDPAEYQVHWQNCLSELGLWSDSFQDQLHNLDNYLDQVEEIIENWANENGIEQNSVLTSY